MRQEEFLNSLQEALAGKVPDSIIRENVNYYRNYINSQMNNGKTEEEVLRSLGDPRLLAKTIEESSKFASEEEKSFYQDAGSNTYQTRENMESSGRHYGKTIRIPSWLLSIIVIMVIALVIAVAFSLISFFTPVILIVLIVMLVCSLVRTWTR